ncbi:ATP synthase gamma chain [Labeo rohita]|uniref:ATP synthase gamma chain n=1 Tax=Labeo rohita TaxID=84645 RepID=A0ABQ8L6M8_LABRO|nr:ATP synthase gamma chain [Labeo rohita]
MDIINITCGEIQTPVGFLYVILPVLLNHTNNPNCEQSWHSEDERLIVDPSDPQRKIDPVISVSSDRLVTSHCVNLKHEIRCDSTDGFHFSHVTAFRVRNQTAATPNSDQLWLLAVFIIIMFLAFLCFLLRKRIFSDAPESSTDRMTTVMMTSLQLRGSRRTENSVKMATGPETLPVSQERKIPQRLRESRPESPSVRNMHKVCAAGTIRKSKQHPVIKVPGSLTYSDRGFTIRAIHNFHTGTCIIIETDGRFKYKLHPDLLNHTNNPDCDQSWYSQDGRLIADPSDPQKRIDPVISVSSDRLVTSYCVDELHHEIICHSDGLRYDTTFRAFNDSISGSTQTAESNQLCWISAPIFIVFLGLICFLLRKRIFRCFESVCQRKDPENKDPEPGVQIKLRSNQSDLLNQSESEQINDHFWWLLAVFIIALLIIILICLMKRKRIFRLYHLVPEGYEDGNIVRRRIILLSATKLFTSDLLTEIQTGGGFEFKLPSDSLNQTLNPDCEQSWYLQDGFKIADPSDPQTLIDPATVVKSDRLFTSHCVNLNHEIICDSIGSHFSREIMFRVRNQTAVTPNSEARVKTRLLNHMRLYKSKSKGLTEAAWERRMSFIGVGH